MKNGFTLIEILVSLVILTLVMGAGWFSFSGYTARKELDSTTARVAALVAEAKSKTLAGEAGSAWGVHFEETKAVLFKAPTYQAGAADNKTEAMPRRVLISSISFSNSEAIFKRLTGAALSAGSVTLSVRGNASLFKTISVNALGVIEGD